MKFDNRTIEPRVYKAIMDAEYLLLPDSKMMAELAVKDDFAFNSGTGKEVVHKIVNCNKKAAVYFYKPFNPFTKALGYSDGKDIHLNVRVFDKLSHNDLVGLLCHEWLHFLFSHGNNYKTEFKVKFSVNYFVSENVSRWL